MALVPPQAQRPWEAEQTKIGFRFEGGIAEAGQLNFYEAGRYRYAAARALYTLEEFRISGNVIERLTKQVNADFRISAPSEGSFLEEVYYHAAPLLGDGQLLHSFASIPFSKILPWVFDKIIPKSSNNQRIADIANKLVDVVSEQTLVTERILGEREVTARHQADQDTEKLRIIARLAEAAISRGNQLQENRAVAGDLAEVAGRHVKRAEEDNDPDRDPAFVASELLAEENRAELIADYEDQLSQIPIDKEQLLIEQLRKTLKDIGYPLQRSASNLKFEVGNDNVPIVSLNENRLKQIVTVRREDTLITLSGGIIRLDKDYGFGRFRPTDVTSSIPFTTPREIYQRNKRVFIRAFGVNEVVMEAYPYRDGIGNITKLSVVKLRLLS